MSIYQITGRIIDRKIGFGIPNMRIEAWDKDLLFDDFVGQTETDKDGYFFISFDESYFRGIFFDRKPDLYFKIFRNKDLIEDTKDNVLWNVANQNISLEIKVEATKEEIEKYYDDSGIEEPETYLKNSLILDR